jgi:hypothetical protein
MSRTAADVRQTVVPSSSLLPYTHVGFSIATTQSYSREFFNTIDPEQPVVRERSGRSRTDGPLALEPSVSHAAKAERQC